MEMTQKNIICFGEMLWDMLPTGKMPGGAPMNVAIHLKNFGNNATIISRVGTDDLGTELVDFVKENGLDTQLTAFGAPLSTTQIQRLMLARAIVGKPNAGKSTLLNVLLEEDKAIVSEIPGTTRDVIEDELNIDGVLFRIIDTAGIRETNDIIESIGVEKAYEQIKLSSIAIYLFEH